jgi:hypothetical protein
MTEKQCSPILAITDDNKRLQWWNFGTLQLVSWLLAVIQLWDQYTQNLVTAARLVRLRTDKCFDANFGETIQQFRCLVCWVNLNLWAFVNNRIIVTIMDFCDRLSTFYKNMLHPAGQKIVHLQGTNKNTELRGLRPQANNADRVTAACRQS